MKLMMLVELGSTGVDEISVFHRLSEGKGTNPLPDRHSTTGPCLREGGSWNDKEEDGYNKAAFLHRGSFEREPLWSQG